MRRGRRDRCDALGTSVEGVPDQISGGRQEIRDGIDVIHPGRIEKSGEVDGMLSRVHGDLYRAVGDEGNGPFVVTAGSPQTTPEGTPGPLMRGELVPQPFKMLGQRVEGSGLVTAGARLLCAPGARSGRRLAGSCHVISRESVSSVQVPNSYAT
jgi:hypothetical protein